MQMKSGLLRFLYFRIFFVTVLAFSFGCRQGREPDQAELALAEAKRNFKTKIITVLEGGSTPDVPPGAWFNLIQYPSPVGELAAYVTKDPGDGGKHPAIVWITGGDTNSIGDVWSPQKATNDQSASPIREAGIVMMFPSQRGGNDNPGQREGFYGEVEDILAATDYLVQLPYVDPDAIYLGGHSTGGTMAILVAASTSRYKAVFSLGPVSKIDHYGGDFIYCDRKDQEELKLRSPIYWLHGVETPLFIFEGSEPGNWDSIEMMKNENTNPKISFYYYPNYDHFSLIHPLTERIATQIKEKSINPSAFEF